MPQRLAVSLALVAAIIVVSWGVSHRQAPTNCTEQYRTDEVIKTPDKSQIKVQVAKTESEREKGLSGRRCLATNQGMLFVFDKSGYYPFWMKGMRFPIDIVWISADKGVVQVNDYVQPSSYPHAILPSQPVKYVLELNAGQAAAQTVYPAGQLTF